MTLRRLLCALLLLLPAPLWAQEQDEPPAMLVADRVFISPDRRLVAEGNVEAFQGQTRLSAARITFDRATGRLIVDGPIRIDEGGRITVLASFGELDRGLQNGLLRGARIVMDQQLQLAAAQMTRVNGRYSQLYKTSVTSCHVCDDDRPPLWQIRARRITHDQAEQQLYFEEAQFRILDVPVFYVPAMRLPDPTLDRATGFLIPSLRSTTNLETGIKLPYFFRLGDHADLTLTPYVSARTETLEYRYRHAFRRGSYQFEGAHTRDDLRPGKTRGYLFGNGHFDLGGGFQLDFQVQTASDNAYLSDYGHDDLDRLQSELALSRFTANSAFRTRLIGYDTLRDADTESQLPTLVFSSTFERRFFPARLGGEIRLGADLHAHRRSSVTDVLGRDVTRGTLDLSWRRNWLLGAGILAEGQIGVAADTFNIDEDSNFPNRISRVTPRAALSFRLPMTRQYASGATGFLEPLMQIGWTDVHGTAPPNEESTFVEFDQGNLLSLSRFPAYDRRETGATLAWGLNWAHYSMRGWQATATVGQVLREAAHSDFTATSGLAGTRSDLLLAGQIRIDDTLSLSARTLMDSDFGLSKAELRGNWQNDRVGLSGTYLWLDSDTAESRPTELSEIWLDGSYEVSRGWTAAASLRYDIASDRATRAGLGLTYRNECVTVDLSVSRRYTSSTSIEPTTDFGFTIALSGFSVDQAAEKYRRSCS